MVRFVDWALCACGEEMSGRLGRHVIGRYGVGTLWCVREEDAFFVQFNAKKIARRSLKGGAWTALQKEWKVTPAVAVKSSSSLITAREFSFRSTQIWASEAGPITYRRLPEMLAHHAYTVKVLPCSRSLSRWLARARSNQELKLSWAVAATRNHMFGHAYDSEPTVSRNLRSTSLTCWGCQRWPKAVGAPRRFSSLAMPRRLVMPLACSSTIRGARSAALPFARALPIAVPRAWAADKRCLFTLASTSFARMTEAVLREADEEGKDSTSDRAGEHLK
jgi:hypothetical protein